MCPNRDINPAVAVSCQAQTHSVINNLWVGVFFGRELLRYRGLPEQRQLRAYSGCEPDTYNGYRSSQWRIQSWYQGGGGVSKCHKCKWLVKFGDSKCLTPWFKKIRAGGGFPGNQKTPLDTPLALTAVSPDTHHHVGWEQVNDPIYNIRLMRTSLRHRCVHWCFQVTW